MWSQLKIIDETDGILISFVKKVFPHCGKLFIVSSLILVEIDPLDDIFEEMHS